MPCPPGSLHSAAAKHANWVDKTGGLPRYIERIACHLVDKGMEKGYAIATAVNVCKRMCSTGDLNYPGIQHAKADHQSEACAAVASWEAKRAAAHAESTAKAA